MKKDVIISIKGLQDSDDVQNDKVEFVTDGEYINENGIKELSYMDSELTGMRGTKTTFRIEPERVMLTREGTLNAQMLFEEGKKHFFYYNTQFGSISMSVDTHSISTSLGDNGGDIEIHYVLNMENAVVSRNVFKINVREA